MLGTIAKSLSSSQLARLNKFADRVNKFGANFAVCDCDGELVLVCQAGKFESSPKQLAEYGRTILKQSDDQSRCNAEDSVCSFAQENRILHAVLNSADHTPTLVALIDLGQCSATGNNQLKGPSNQQNVEYGQRADILEASLQPTSRHLQEMLALFAEHFQDQQQAEQQIEMVSTELAKVYEELVLLYKLSTNMKVTVSDANYLQMACDSLTDIISVEGIAVLLDKTVDDEKRLVLAAGSGLIDMDEHTAAVLQSRLIEEMASGRDALLDSEVDSPFNYDWPDNIASIIAVPLYSNESIAAHSARTVPADSSIVGLMVAINRMGKQDFDSTDVKLFNSVANGCAVFIENGRLFRDLKELFIGSLKALTSSIDAKDQYTRGHSERVAFISRWITERLAEQEPLEQEQIHKIYLAGLLHDIGKVGIDEAILRKKGKLTEQELNHIRAHPVIGASILSEIKQMRDIVPGVLSHHERPDGKGYPNGLTSGQIPLVGSIVGLADSFDAMTSKRVYRDALTVQQALAQIKEGLGTQFDEKVGRVFLNSDVYELWDTMQDGVAEIYGSRSFLEYGAVAVGTLIK